MNHLTEMKGKGSICSFFSPKRKATEVENELSKVDGGDEVEGERQDEDEVKGEREGQHKRDRDRIQGQGDQGQEEVGEHHSSEDVEEGEHHQDEEDLPDAPRTVFTSFKGYRNWKKDTMKDSGFCSCARSEGHVNAMFAWTENKKVMDKNTSMFGLMDEQKSRWLKINTALKH